LVRRIYRKIWGNVDKIFKYEYYGDSSPDILITVFGSMSRVSIDALSKLKKNGFKVGVLKLITVWPINYDILKDYIRDASLVVVPEMNLGQLIYDVKMIGGEKVYNFNKIGGGIPIYTSELVEYIQGVYKR